MLPKPIRFGIDDAQHAVDTWGFNCGPGAICAVLDLTPIEVLPLMGDFERKGYTDPKLMVEVLARAGATFTQVYRSDEPKDFPPVRFGLVRVQWGGPWTKPGVPMIARQRHTHWVAMCQGPVHVHVFDVNAVCVGGWIPWEEWFYKLMPWLAGEVVPKWDGRIWPTHILEVATSKGGQRP